MSSDDIITVSGLGKKYRLRHNAEPKGYATLRDVIAGKVRGLFSKSTKASAAGREDFWALKDVSFEVKRGEVLGVIGGNGAGKSTLLKILSRITEPTHGRVHLRGRVASLLEVGTGFHPELTGRENIFLNGAILGMSRGEIRRKFDEIVEFAEVAKFLDTPVKRYSSGMYVRLAFAVAAHLEPEILIVDEVLAVGDVQFQQKCLGKMEQVSKGGRTVLLVSHNMRTVSALCSSCICLRRGAISSVGNPTDVIADYIKGGAAERIMSRSLEESPRHGDQGKLMKFQTIKLVTDAADGCLVMGQPLVFEIQAIGRERLTDVFFGLGIDDIYGNRLFTVEGEQQLMKEVHGGQIVRARVEIPQCGLRPGSYTVTIGINSGINESIDHFHEALSFEIVASAANLMQAERANLGLSLSSNWVHEITPGAAPAAGVRV